VRPVALGVGARLKRCLQPRSAAAQDAAMDIPAVRYAGSDDVALAYQIVGEGSDPRLRIGPGDVGEHELKGVPDHWHLNRVVNK
jgi:hypothetical protein